MHGGEGEWVSYLESMTYFKCNKPIVWRIGDGGTWFRNRLPEGRILKRERGTRDKMIINSTQKVSSRVLKSRNMMSVARTSFI